jgi:hypothetical protein
MFGKVKGSGNAATENRVVTAFSKIEISGSANVTVAIGPVQSLTLTIDDNLLPLIETKVEGDTLSIRSTKSYHSDLGLKIAIVVPSLDSLSVSGAAKMKVSGLNASTFTLDVSGAGDAVLTGKTDQFDAHLSGAGNLQAENLVAKNVEVEISGAGNAVVFATQSLDASIAGAGSVSYGGSPPQVRQNVSGFGSIKPL